MKVAKLPESPIPLNMPSLILGSLIWFRVCSQLRDIGLSGQNKNAVAGWLLLSLFATSPAEMEGASTDGDRRSLRRYELQEGLAKTCVKYLPKVSPQLMTAYAVGLF